jgi:hypothetical protein
MIIRDLISGALPIWWTRWIRSASIRRAILRGVLRKNHTWGTRHLAGPIRDVGSAGRCESVSGARCRYEFGETWQLAVVKDSCVARNTFFKTSAEWSTSDAAVSERQQPVEGTPKGRTRLLAVCSTPGQLNHFVALALQQYGEQSALRKGPS